MLLEVKNLCISYKEPLIKDLSFCLIQNQILGIKGKNGSGKTSLCLALAGILDEAFIQGEINIQGEDILDMPISERCQNIGIVFQRPEEQIFSPIVEDEIVFGMENLRFERNVMQDRLSEVLNLLGISKLRKQKTNSLSLGQKQLVAIASVLVMEPKILIADEISSLLDEDNKKLVRKVLKDYANDGRGVIVVSHSKEDLEICDKIIELGGQDED